MATMDLLSNKFEAFLEEEMIDCEIPSCIKDNINNKFKLRPYQIDSQSLLRYYLEKYKKKVKPVHLMFNLATGSGKTLLMASNILYLYDIGYRNFIFFVNSTNIIDKTKYNFLDYTSSKFLFNNKITINNKIVDIREVSNLEDADDESINIMFTTIQGLHYKLNTPTEGSITYEDFKDKKVVLLSDEAHHLNTLTKSKLNKTEEEEKNSWEHTVNNILHHNQDNILLEYTATAELENPLVYDKYKDKVIYKYDLSKFRKDKYSKEVTVLQSDNKIKERLLQAVITSEYRRKVAEKHGIVLKPVILIKSNKIAQSKEILENFNNWIINLTIEDLNKLKSDEDNNVITKAFKFFEDENISLNNLILEIKYQFNEDKCIEVNNKEESEQKQIIVNTLEDKGNMYRAVFAVDMLNEGWDVLNLFDIVRVDDGRGSKATTTKEAQLIGRGARYCPFTLDDTEDKYKRKYDNDLDNELRILEELYYHSINEPKYISDLKKELKENGIIEDDSNKIIVDLKLKDSFKKTNVFKNGVIFVNRQVVNTNKDIEALSQMKVDLSYDFDLKTGNVKEIHILDDYTDNDKANNLTPTTFSIKDFGYNVIRKAISKNEFYSFGNLKKYLPNLQSMNEFITDNKYLGAIEVTIRSKYTEIDDIDNIELLDIVLDILKEIEGKIKKNYIPYIGTKEFYPKALKNLNFEKKASFISGGEDKEMGKSMSRLEGDLSLRLDLMNEEWYAYEDNYGTSEEKRLILLMKSVYEDLINSGYEDVYLIRNEKILKLYHFDTDQVTEPDFLLWAKKKEDSEYKYYQLFIEPKGDHLLEKDKWKEELLLRIEDEYLAVLSKPNEVIKESTAVYEVEETLLPKDVSFDVENSVLVDNERYKLIGLSFYNKSQEKEFKDEFKQKLEI
ncbi:Uncharacterized protein conserved in bacteria [[Clostridium] sordellii]|uniref:DEAD/DEAH box helicase family protein n=1 Tax=Paraclostridium sordellii TaxID=1505 RepID=UPI0005DEE778|nr:DEAD/DEAH box helicase family protein [Paeniclostridium sordellii]CEO12448.1 Uncharacterized protein conserved in bacteria [[Clostridium] sordellii] [Paeniclostridium sordellii]